MSAEPQLAVSTDYASNAYLQPTDRRSIADVALLVNSPISYDLDNMHLSAAPSARYSSQGSYASVASNYYRLNGGARYVTDLDTVSFNPAISRDSSLYQSGLKTGGLGVRTDQSSAQGRWDHLFTERLSVTTDFGWNRALYSENAGVVGLRDYRYLNESAAATYIYDESTSVQATVTGGHYNTLSDATRSNIYSAMLTGIRQVNEQWTVNVSAGFSKAYNSQQIFYGPFLINGTIAGPYYLGTVHAIQQGPVYGLNLQRQGEHLTLTATASRTYRPSGFQFLTRTDAAQLGFNDIWSERWSFSSSIGYQSLSTPTPSAPTQTVRYLEGHAGAEYTLTPQWKVSLHASWVQVKYNLPPVTADSTGVSLQMTRQFLRIDL